LAAVPEFGRAARVEPSTPPGADATRELFERFSSQIYGYCLHQLGSREEAEDAVQTTFMNVYRGLQRGIVPRVEGAWLFKIAQNVCLSRRRSTRRRGRVEAPNNFEVLQDVVPARERSTDELIRLNDALQGMPEAQRRAILLREWQGLSYREIAERIGISQAAVETLIFRARRSLAAGLEKTDDGGWRKRARHGVDAGGVLAALKSIFATGTTVKVAATDRSCGGGRVASRAFDSSRGRAHAGRRRSDCTPRRCA
jgi:RNA polymerase sigma-70 factor (ECF subfamily)